MEYVQDQDIQNSISQEMINLMLNNFLEEVTTTKSNVEEDLSTCFAVDNKHVIQSDALIMDIENSFTTIKVELEIDEFEIENRPVNTCINYNMKECIKEESKLISLLENTNGIEEYENCIVNDLLETPDASLNRHEKPDSNQETPVKVETSEGLNLDEKMHEITYEEWKLNNEEIQIKEELEQNETSILANKAEHNKTRPVHKLRQQHNHQIRKRYNYRNVEKNTVYIFKCDQCQYKSIVKSDLHKHLLRHKNLKKVNSFKCHQCEYKSSAKRNLQRHLLLHKNPEEVNIFKCDQCEYKTIQKGNLKAHLLLHRNLEEVNMFKCNQCEYKTIRKGDLNKHLLLHKNPEEVNMFKCDQCEYQNSHKSNLSQHLLRHRNPKEDNMLRCDQCQYQTIHKHYLKRHLLRHMNPEKVQMFKCDQCEYQNSQKTNLSRHLRRHMNLKKVTMFKCDQCEFQTIYKDSLKKHVLRHL